MVWVFEILTGRETARNLGTSRSAETQTMDMSNAEYIICMKTRSAVPVVVIFQMCTPHWKLKASKCVSE